MTRQRTVLVAGAISALLLSASATFAVSSGLFGSGRAERVGTFQAIEQRLSPASVPATSAPRSPARTLTPPQSAPATSSSPRADDVTPSHTPDSDGATPATTVAPPERSATTTSGPEHLADHPADHPDDGRESDD